LLLGRQVDGLGIRRHGNEQAEQEADCSGRFTGIHENGMKSRHF
jgi:hypothetical protein